ncbi:MAG: ABC transporter ATP-binding protein, partial [Acetobacteraceae bacterium]
RSGGHRRLSRHAGGRNAMTPILRVEAIDVYYGASQILFGVGLDVLQGQTMALLGRNGAGKSTTMKTIAGVLAPRTGRIEFRGKQVAGSKPNVIARAGLAYVPEDRQVFPDHSVTDNLAIAAKRGASGQDEWPLSRVWEVFPLLEKLRARAAGRLSGGEQQMLAIARALMGNPEMLLLDEPSEGLAPIIVQRIGVLLRQLRASGTTVLIAEQNMHFCLGVATHAVVIDKGQIVYRDDIAGLRANEAVRRRYLAMGTAPTVMVGEGRPSTT